MSILLLVGCKSKTDWRTKYNEEKTTTTKTVRKATTDAPKSIDDYAKMLDVSKGSLTNDTSILSLAIGMELPTNLADKASKELTVRGLQTFYIVKFIMFNFRVPQKILQ